MIEGLNLAALLGYLKWAAIVAAGLYVVAVFGISMLAAKLRDRNAWMAWIPVVNLYLLCSMARSNPLVLLLALIPVVNVPVFCYLGMRISRRLDSSELLGMMFGVPVIGAFVPLLLALDGTTPALPPGARRAPPPFVAATLNCVAALMVLLILGGAYTLTDRMTQAAVPTAAQAVAQLPQRVGGTLTVFPIDTDAAKPALPANVITTAFSADGQGSPMGMQIRPDQLPPWVDPYALGAMAENATSADYRTDTAAAPVSVVALSLREGNTAAFNAPTADVLSQFDAGGEVEGISVETAGGVVYQGYRVVSATSAYYALRDAESNTGMIISASDPAGVAVAERLAGNVGNGQGLMEYDSYRGSFGQVPVAPAGYPLAFVQTYTEEDIALIVNQINEQAAGEQLDAEQQAMLDMARSIVPSNVSIAAYGNVDSSDVYFAGIAGYSSASDSWAALQVLWAAKSFIPGDMSVTINTIDIAGTTAYSVDLAEDGTHAGGIILRRGGALAGLGSSTLTSAELVPWAEAFMASE